MNFFIFMKDYKKKDDKEISLSQKELKEKKDNEIFLNNMLKRMKDKTYI